MRTQASRLPPDPDVPRVRRPHDAVTARIVAALAAVAMIVGVVASRGGNSPRDLAAAPPAAPAALAAPAGARLAGGIPARTPAADAELALAARQMMADVAIARIALGAQLDDDAREHVESALPIAESLVQRTTVPAAAGGASRSAWLPLQEDERIVRTLEDSLARRHEGAVVAAEAHAVHTHRAVDPRTVQRKLQAAESALERGDTPAAAEALDGAESSVIAETSVRDLPLERVRDNLVLARQLAGDGAYGGASDALGYARAALADAELADATVRSRPEATRLRDEMQSLQAQIGTQEPAGLRRLQAAMGRAFDAVAAWLRRLAG